MSYLAELKYKHNNFDSKGNVFEGTDGLISYQYRQYRGEQWKFKFPNGYGASVLFANFSYGYSKGLFELAVVKWDGDYMELCYDTEITDDVVRGASKEDVLNILEKIKSLA